MITLRLEKEGIEYDLDKMRGYLMKPTTHCLRNKCKNGIKRTDEKTTSSTSNELEKTSLGEGSNGVVGKPTMKRVSLLWAYGKHFKTELKFCH